MSKYSVIYGDPPWRIKTGRPLSGYTVENGSPKHSKKPDYFYQLIEETSPGRKLELFARQKRPGWDVWGNEVDSDIELTIV